MQSVKPPNRSGRRILQAKELVGSVEDWDSVTPSTSGLSRSQDFGSNQQTPAKVPIWTPQDTPLPSDDNIKSFQEPSLFNFMHSSTASTPIISGDGAVSSHNFDFGETSSASHPFTNHQLFFQSGPDQIYQQSLTPNLDVISMSDMSSWAQGMGLQSGDKLENTEMSNWMGPGTVATYGSGTTDKLVRYALGTELNR